MSISEKEKLEIKGVKLSNAEVNALKLLMFLNIKFPGQEGLIQHQFNKRYPDYSYPIFCEILTLINDAATELYVQREWPILSRINQQLERVEYAEPEAEV